MRALVPSASRRATFVLLSLTIVPWNSAAFQNDDRAVTQSLVEQTRSADVEIRRDAAYRLGFVGDASVALAPLVGLLDDAEEILRATSADSLGRLKAPAAVDPLVERLRREKRPFVRKIIVGALGCIGDARALEPLVDRLNRDKDREVRAAAATALGALGDRAAEDPLAKRIADKDAFIRREAIRALGILHAVGAVDRIIQRLESDAEADVRRHAAEALGKIGDRSALAALTAALRDQDPYVALAAEAALADLKHTDPN